MIVCYVREYVVPYDSYKCFIFYQFWLSDKNNIYNNVIYIVYIFYDENSLIFKCMLFLSISQGKNGEIGLQGPGGDKV